MGPLIDPFLDNGFMLRALLAGVLVSISCAVVGTFVVLRGLAFIGDALAHGVLPGIAAALLIGAPGLVGATVGALAMIGGVALITRRSRLSSDTAIGLLFVGMLALGVVDRVALELLRRRPGGHPVRADPGHQLGVDRRSWRWRRSA